ncbi:MAG: hypothetical protein DI530_15135 [Sphingomonas sp.]|uniref:hypothetical protein n=1 Tax=Sphingomonas sp. TaxID=28214 RepID=UPI000DBBE825|nr:hypothetical protein [Sphingomonas sp.]PZU75583.1 MAG: hypothetical protein DI530_15135 [Sphingomonas sp.]
MTQTTPTDSVDAMRQALEDVCNPLGYLRRKAEAEGNRLGGMAYAIANDIATVQQIARDALSTLPSDGVTIPEGWVLVPREPTEAMQQAFVDAALRSSIEGVGGWSAYAREQWATMLAAAPKAPPVAQTEGVERLALEAIKAVTATTKDAAAGLSRIMAIARSAGVAEPYSDLMAKPDVQMIVSRPRNEWRHLFEHAGNCTIPPAGWRCTRAAGHDGPCAAVAALSATTEQGEGE